ncbi:MAG TPA: hypothetical protein ENG48_02675 [Candidatus Atribacteria bacterium]|nr:hypothetical protein [Candidatus Atribacteria bacterium]
MKSFFEQEKKKEVKKFLKGVPKRDGSGGGLRLNKGRGGCEKPQEFGKGMNQNLKNVLFGAGTILIGTKLLESLGE